MTKEPLTYETIFGQRRMAVREVARLRSEKNALLRALQTAQSAIDMLDSEAVSLKEIRAEIEEAMKLPQEKEFNPDDYL
ncbi:MAG: hypothetical protein EOO38_32360 [Cytophagaceae bacterium]|nr:MAG: hypothetical protein EOO38_32360 [Cytophagaceae bacterium]